MTSTPADEQSATAPTMLRMLLGAQLRRLREERGITREQAGYEIRSSESKISRMELGRVSFRQRDVADLLTYYGVAHDDPERGRLLSLMKEANAPGWWHQFGDLMPTWLQPYVDLEGAASRIRTYEVQFVPGLLQTRDYARAVVKLGHGHAPAAEIERRVDLRLTRQQVLRRVDPPQLWAVIDEAVLHRPVGGTQVLREQIEALVEATRQPNISVQIMPFQSGGSAATGGSFTLLRFPDDGLSDVAYVELLTSALYLERPNDVEAYSKAIELLCVEAKPPEQTADLLEKLLKEMS